MSHAALSLLTWALAGAPQTAPPACPPAVSLPEALERVDALPELEASAQARRLYADKTGGLGWLQGSTQLTFEPGLRAWPQGQMGPEGALGVSHTFLASSVGAARRAQAGSEEEWLAAQRDALLLERRLALAAAWVEAWEFRRLLEAAQREEEVARGLVNRLQGAVAAGGALSTDVARAQAWAAELRLSAVDLEGIAWESELEVSRLLACSPARRVAALGEPRRQDAATGEAGRPPSAVADAQAERERARLRTVTAGVAPQTTVGARLEADGRQTFRGLGTLQVSLPTFERAQLQRGAGAADLAVAEGRAARTRADERHALERMEHEVEHTAEVLEVLEDQVLPALTRAAALEEQALAAGESTVVELLRSRAAALAAERRAVQARAELLRAELRREIFLRARRPEHGGVAR